MSVILIQNAAILICSAIGVVFGAFRYLRPKKPLYASMIVLGLACIMLGRLYQTIQLWTGNDIAGVFQIGTLGTTGAFSFFFSANFGQIDSLADSGDKKLQRYRIIAWAGPVCIAALYAIILLSPAKMPLKAIYGFTAFMIAQAAYFHIKHLLIPDVDYGVVRCQRGYNALAFCLGIMDMIEIIAMLKGNETLLIISGAALSILSLAIIPVMDRGVKKWTT